MAPVPNKPQKDLCQALTVSTAWKRAHGDNLRCQYFARIRINGKDLCNRHAELEALAVLVRDKSAEILPTPPQIHIPYTGVKVAKEEL